MCDADVVIPCRLAAGVDPVTGGQAEFWRRGETVYLVAGTGGLPPTGPAFRPELDMPEQTWAAMRRRGAWPWAVDV